MIIKHYANIENQEAVDSLLLAVKYEKLDMEIMLKENSMKPHKATLNSKDKTESEKAVASEKLAVMKVELAKLTENLAEVKEVHKKVVDAITSASMYYPNGELVQNNTEATRNVLRLMACTDGKKYFAVCNLVEAEMLEELYELFSLIHNPDHVDSHGRSILETKKVSYKECNQLVDKVIWKYFTIPVENEYTTAIRIHLGGTNMAKLHEAFVKGINIEYTINKDTKEFQSAETKLTTSITKTEKRDGTAEYKGYEFMRQVAMLTFERMYK